MKKYILVLLFCSSVFAVNGYNLNKRYVQGDTVTATNLTGNLDSGRVWSSTIADTMNYVVPRNKNLYRNHDSIFNWMNIDTIGGTVRMDSITGLKRVTTDSVIGAVRGNITGSVTGNITGNVTGNVTGSISGGTVAGSTGAFTSTVTVDSLKSTKGVNATSGNFTSLILNSGSSVTGFSVINSNAPNSGNPGKRYPLPTGYTVNNTYIVDVLIKHSSYWYDFGRWNTNSSRELLLDPTGTPDSVWVWHGTEPWTTSDSIRILLMKID